MKDNSKVIEKEFGISKRAFKTASRLQGRQDKDHRRTLRYCPEERAELAKKGTAKTGCCERASLRRRSRYPDGHRSPCQTEKAL
ncbi:MAG: hypothetical protein ACLTDF_02085 [Coprococcus sp.]